MSKTNNSETPLQHAYWKEIAILSFHTGSQAAGLESIPSPIFPDGPGPPSQAAEAIKSKAEAAAEAFEKSDFLKGLREKSDLNRDKCAFPCMLKILHGRMLCQLTESHWSKQGWGPSWRMLACASHL